MPPATTRRIVTRATVPDLVQAPTARTGASLAAQHDQRGAREDRLHDFAAKAVGRLASMSAEQRKELAALLDLRVEVTDPEARAVSIAGVLPQAVVDGRGGSWHDSQA